MLLAASPACAPGLLRSEGPADAQTVGVPCLPTPSPLADMGRQSVTPSVSVDKGNNGTSWCRVCQAVGLAGTLQIKKSICTQVRRGRVGRSAKRQSPARDTDSDVRHQGRRQLPEGRGVGRKHAGKPPQAQGPPQPPTQPTILASVRFLGRGWEEFWKSLYPQKVQEPTLVSTCTEQGAVLSCRG